MDYVLYSKIESEAGFRESNKDIFLRYTYFISFVLCGNIWIVKRYL